MSESPSSEEGCKSHAHLDFVRPFSSNSYRTTSEEKRYDERMAMEDPEVTYNNIRRAAEVHRQVRKYARKTIRPGMRMLEIADLIENGVRNLVEENGLESGIGFPTGLSLNHCAAHYSPNSGDTIGECLRADVWGIDTAPPPRGRRRWTRADNAVGQSLERKMC